MSNKNKSASNKAQNNKHQAAGTTIDKPAANSDQKAHMPCKNSLPT